MAYAGVAIRYLAILLDLMVLSAVFFPVTRIAKGTWIMSASDHRWAHGWFVTDPLCLAFLAAIFLYFVLFEAFAGATPGKMAAGLRVVRPVGGRPGLPRSLVRNVLRVVDGLPALGILGAVLIATSGDRTRIGDRLAQTRVVQSRAKA